MTLQSHEALAIHPIDPLLQAGHPQQLQRRLALRRARLAALLLLLLLAAGLGRTWLVRLSNAHTLQAAAKTLSVQYVKTTFPKISDTTEHLQLPGTLQGWVQTPVSSRASGYLLRWTKDIGERVQKGELLAELDTPEIDKALSQAVASRSQSKASLTIAKSTAARWEALRKKDVVSQQDLDERRSALSQAQANLAASHANVERLEKTSGFKKVLAPFSGVIQRRFVEVGDLIDGNSGRPLFTLSQTDPLRVYVNVPQAYAHLVLVGQLCSVTQAELVHQSFQCKVTRTSESIDPTTHMMQVEITLANKEGLLMPGAFVEVTLSLPPDKTPQIPTNALLFRAQGTEVAVVSNQGQVALHRVTLGRNLGESIEVLGGLTPSDRIVLNPPDSLTDGDQVSVVEDKP